MQNRTHNYSRKISICVKWEKNNIFKYNKNRQYLKIIFKNGNKLLSGAINEHKLSDIIQCPDLERQQSERREAEEEATPRKSCLSLLSTCVGACALLDTPLTTCTFFYIPAYNTRAPNLFSDKPGSSDVSRCDWTHSAETPPPTEGVRGCVRASPRCKTQQHRASASGGHTHSSLRKLRGHLNWQRDQRETQRYFFLFLLLLLLQSHWADMDF